MHVSQIKVLNYYCILVPLSTINWGIGKGLSVRNTQGNASLQDYSCRFLGTLIRVGRRLVKIIDAGVSTINNNEGTIEVAVC